MLIRHHSVFKSSEILSRPNCFQFYVRILFILCFILIYLGKWKYFDDQKWLRTPALTGSLRQLSEFRIQ